MEYLLTVSRKVCVGVIALMMAGSSAAQESKATGATGVSTTSIHPTASGGGCGGIAETGGSAVSVLLKGLAEPFPKDFNYAAALDKIAFSDNKGLRIINLALFMPAIAEQLNVYEYTYSVATKMNLYLPIVVEMHSRTAAAIRSMTKETGELSAIEAVQRNWSSVIRLQERATSGQDPSAKANYVALQQLLSCTAAAREMLDISALHYKQWTTLDGLYRTYRYRDRDKPWPFGDVDAIQIRILIDLVTSSDLVEAKRRTTTNAAALREAEGRKTRDAGPSLLGLFLAALINRQVEMSEMESNRLCSYQPQFGDGETYVDAFGHKQVNRGYIGETYVCRYRY